MVTGPGSGEPFLSLHILPSHCVLTGFFPLVRLHACAYAHRANPLMFLLFLYPVLYIQG